MTRGRDVFRVVGVWLVLCGAVQGDKHDQRDFTIRTTSRLVLLDVSVQDAQGGFITGLSRDNFKVYENGKPQQISEFSNADIPVTTGLVVDESGSMRPKRSEVIAAALAFIQASNAQDEIFVVNFNEKARRGLPDGMAFSDDVPTLRAALWKGTPEGRTALYDAVELALGQLAEGHRDKKTLVVISDGGDNVSTHGLPRVMHDVLTSISTVYTVGIFDADDPEKNPGVLRQLARVTGGAAYFPQKLEETIPICKQIAKDIRTRYTIGYIPSLSNGKAERRIRVTAFSDRGAKLMVRTRTSYSFSADSAEANVR
jgi:Ca-activated chloride channel family protein